MRKLLFHSTALLAVAAIVGMAFQAKPINSKCPIKGTDVKPGITAEYEGKVIGFCWGGCKGKFAADPKSFVGSIPELKGQLAKANPKKEEAKKPEATGPCDCSKIGKGYYCTMCKRELGPDDVRNNACKKCEIKPEQIDYCVKYGAPFFVCATCGKKGGDKPFMCCFKMQKNQSVSEDRARIFYECDTCAAKGEVQSEIKHKDDCKPKFGGGVKKICQKSGKAPHVSDAK